MTIQELATMYHVSKQAISQRLTSEAKKRGVPLNTLRDANTHRITSAGEAVLAEVYKLPSDDKTPQIAEKPHTDEVDATVDKLTKQVDELTREVDALRAQVDELKTEKEKLYQALTNEQQLHAMALRLLPQPADNGADQGDTASTTDGKRSRLSRAWSALRGK